jgi:pyrroline-5-carboxylate reductase
VDLKGVIAETSELLTPDKLIVSVAVDFSLRQLENLCRARAARAIPSVASGKGLGVTLLVLGSDASEDDRSQLFRLFGSIGWPVEVAEEQLEVLSDLTSSGPAYISAILREFALEASMRDGKVDRDLAEQLIKKALIGTASLLEDKSFDDLIAMVATRGGITEEGAKVIEALSPEMFRQLFSATSAKHRLVKDRIGDLEE